MQRNLLRIGIIGATVLLLAGARFVPGQYVPVTLATALPAGNVDVEPAATAAAAAAGGGVAVETAAALAALAGSVGPLSQAQALESAFHSYYAFRAAHPERVRKPYLYFVDYGLPATAARGWVFDMDARAIVEGPFTVAHGRGSAATKDGVPTRFSNSSGSNATSLGLYVAQELYDFYGHAAGQGYSATGLRLTGVSDGFNDNARARRVVAHGAPYVTPAKAGRSEGCPAMEPARARRLLPKLADGGMVFLFAPNASWLAGDPWVNANG